MLFLWKVPQALEEDETDIPSAYTLGQNFPNPISNQTEIEYSLPAKCHVNITVYDNLGRQIATLVNEEKPAGDYSVNFDASGLESGIYYYQLHSEGFAQTRKMIVK